MLRYFVSLTAFLSLSASLFGSEWSVEVPYSSILGLATQCGNNTFVSCNTSTGAVLATWGDTNNHNYPTYSFYNGTSWSYDTTDGIPFTISTTSTVNGDIITSFNPSTGDFLATWNLTSGDSLARYPTYSFYNSMTGWSTAQAITSSSGATGYRGVFNIYNPVTDQFFAAWNDTATSLPFYSIYTSGSWSDPTNIPMASPITFSGDVFLMCDPTTGTVLATWRSTDLEPYYSFYDGSSWSMPLTIAATPPVQDNIYGCFDTSSGQFLAAWADNAGADYPYYSFYNGTSWTTPALIPAEAISGASENVTISQDPATGQILAMWLDFTNSNGAPAYSVYNGSSWSSVNYVSLSESTNEDDAYSCYNPVAGTFFAAWTDVNNVPSYSIFSTSGSSAPTQPAAFVGSQKKNGFAIVQEYYNALSWQNSGNVTSYSLYRNGVLIATPDGSATSYQDHDQPRKNQTYSLVATNGYGSSSAAIAIIGGQ